MPSAGDSLSYFRLLEELGRGGMGAVWKALDTRLDREVALKILPEELARDPERMTSFRAEAKVVASLNHPNIVTIYAVEESDGLHLIAMELVRGTRLSECIPSTGMTLERLLELALPIADAVHAAHERGVTHRDLKPANIMVADEGRVKILDFGLAQFRESEAPLDAAQLPTRTLTTRSEIRGTLPYMSPEQVQDKPLDHRTDLFSLGVVLYEMATGQRPFGGTTAADVIAAILRDYPPPVTERNPALPPELQRTIAHCLQKDRERRLPTAAELRQRLQQIRDDLDTAPLSREALRGAEVSDLTAVAVLPLANMSGDAAQEFFADGMTDALITGLAKIESLQVISRTSVMRYKGAHKPLKEIARELGVGSIVEGTVLRIGERVRITAQLIEAKSDRHLWAESYDREIRDLFALQSEVAQAIAAQVRVKLTAQDERRLQPARSVHPGAHEAYLEGRHFWYRRTPDSVQKGLRCFERAIELDPHYAPAWAGVADSYLVDGGGYLDVPPNEAYPRARRAAQRAVELDPELAEAHTSLAGVVTDFDWNWEAGEQAYRRAIELNPNYSTARYWYADHLARLGRVEEAIREAQHALRVDPLSLTCNFMLAWVRYFARRYDDALRQARKTLELDARYVPAYRLLGWAHEELGNPDEALSAHRRAAELSGDSPSFAGQLGRAYALARRTDEAKRVLARLIETPGRPLCHDVAILHAALGDEKLALDWLSRACDEHDDHVPYLKVNPRLDALRGQPRFGELLLRVRLGD